MRRTSLLGAVLLHAASALHVSKLQRRHILKGCGLAIASPLIAHADDEPVAAEAPVVEEAPPPPPAKTSAIDDARDRAKRYAEFSKTLRRTYDKNQLNAAYAEMVSFEKELARIAPTKEAAEGAKELKQVLRGLYDAAKRDDRRQVAKQVGEVSDAVSCVAAWKSTGERSDVASAAWRKCREIWFRTGTWPTRSSRRRTAASSSTSSRSASCGATGSRGRATRPSNR